MSLLTVNQNCIRINVSKKCLNNLNAIQPIWGAFGSLLIKYGFTVMHQKQNNRNNGQKRMEMLQKIKNSSINRRDDCFLKFSWYYAHQLSKKKRKTINGGYYAELLDQLDDDIKIKRSHLAQKKILFYQDNAPADISSIAIAKLHVKNCALN